MKKMVLLTLLLLGSCTYTYIPLVRESRAPDPRLTIIDAGSSLAQTKRSLRLTLELLVVPESDWLVVQWFDPRNKEVSAKSLYLEPEPQAVTLALPQGTKLEDGLWRAVVSYQGKLARQFSLKVRVPRK